MIPKVFRNPKALWWCQTCCNDRFQFDYATEVLEQSLLSINFALKTDLTMTSLAGSLGWCS